MGGATRQDRIIHVMRRYSMLLRGASIRRTGFSFSASASYGDGGVFRQIRLDFSEIDAPVLPRKNRHRKSG